MKTYSIGRDLNCDIVINDTTDVISRHHALLNVMSSGKMTIIDQSSNGTYVNGIRISPNVPFPVTRKDIVSLAHVSKLDWNMIPRSFNYLSYTLLILTAIIITTSIFLGVKSITHQDKNQNFDNNLIQTDSLNPQKQKQYIDSLINVHHKADSLYLDSIQKAGEKKVLKKKKKQNKKDKSSNKDIQKSKSKQDLG